MGLFKKVRDILFDEEEYTEQIKITPEMRNEETPLKEEVVQERKEVREEPVMVKPIAPTPAPAPTPKAEMSERELFKSDTTFPFFDFDEEEFDSQMPMKTAAPEPVVEKRSSNVFEYERKKKIEKRTDYGRYEKTEITETVERKKFKPSPIISPVYGILNENYDKSDILKRKDPDKVDIQSVRDKAFGEKREMPKVEIKPRTTFYEETETVTITEPAEKEKKVKTIDELLEDTSDLVVDIDRDFENEIELPEINNDVMKAPMLEQEPIEVTQEVKVPEVEDTLESDLFDLIDSMYDSKEEGE
ncbi:MAG: hypothetical protein IJO63_01165 [Bacilli bacterium]|nr:hypothetical protein [Bacilli bacterium]